MLPFITNCRKFLFSESASSVESSPGHVASITLMKLSNFVEERRGVALKKRVSTIQLRPSKGKVCLSQAISSGKTYIMGTAGFDRTMLVPEEKDNLLSYSTLLCSLSPI